MTLPNFLYIGPPKSASTWLFEVLKAHPQVFVPEGKDVYFFDRYYDRGQEWYEAQFEKADESHVAIGEISHDYLYSEEAAERIKAMIPDAKLLTILRNPFDRAYSDFRYINQWSAKKLTFNEALAEHPTIINNGLYARNLQKYLELFGRERIHVMLYDDLLRDPEKLTYDLLDFLGVEFREDLPIRVRPNVSSVSRAPWLTAAARSLAQVARNAGFASVVGKLKYSPLRKLVFKPVAQPKTQVADPTSLARLEAAFVPEIAALEKITGRSLEQWQPVKS